MPSEPEIKHDYLSIESIIIDFAKKHDDIFVRFGSSWYTLRLSKDNENGIEIDVDIDNDEIQLRFFITDDGFHNLQFKENINFESLGKRLEEIYSEVMEKWDEEEKENERKVMAYIERLKEKKKNE